uniref:Uncharacterized protein n=3 Tax=Neisseria meningitidis TaxID=487 RepID=C6SK67_NEIME|nr:hypothetical protein predicted by Glimmer/Critica [Neisseria meningitidis alpha153]CBA07874.1 hypothetical protein predicted by Glimmer/Critica [Neisseria meningitidis alpha275]CCA44478.1 hypothetical protein NMALPHA522_0937 [Neisseria meningitidis alpha522]
MPEKCCTTCFKTHEKTFLPFAQAINQDKAAQSPVPTKGQTT